MWQGVVADRIIYRFTRESISSREWTISTTLRCLIDNIPKLNGGSSCDRGSLKESEIQ